MIGLCAWFLYNSNATQMTANPSYGTTSLSEPCPIVHYGSLGPHDTPTNPATQRGAHTHDIVEMDGEERIYHVLEQDPPAGGEREREEAQAYEVPIQSKATPTSTAPKK